MDSNMSQENGKVYVLKRGSYTAYIKGAHWFYTDEDGIERRCGKKSCLQEPTPVLANDTKNKQISKAFVDSLKPCIYGLQEAPDISWTHFREINMKSTFANFNKNSGGLFEICPYPDDPEGYTTRLGVDYLYEHSYADEGERDRASDSWYEKWELLRPSLHDLVRFK